jgi:hypothetical protein
MRESTAPMPPATGYTNLDNYQRFLLNNPKTSLRNKMSDLGPTAVPKDRTTTKRSKRHEGTADRSVQSEGSAQVWTARSVQPHSATAVGYDSSTLSRAGETSQSFAEDEPPFDNDVQDAAGYSELQAAFERAYEKMLKDPPASVVDTVLSSAWKPRTKKSAVLRTSFQKQNALSTDWDTRSPVYEKKIFYDSIMDQHCRRIVENPGFKQTLLRTRPAADHLLAHRVMDEESTKLANKKASKKKLGRRGRRGKAERWQETVRRFVQGSDKAAGGESQDAAKTRVAANPTGEMPVSTQGETDGAERSDEAAQAGGEAGNQGIGHDGGLDADGVRPGAPAPGDAAGLGQRAMDAVEKLKEAWGVTDDGMNSQFNSLNSIIMSAGHRPEAFQALSEQLEKLWELLLAPEKEVLHVRRYCMGEVSATNLAHLFYQVSRWTQYHLQVQKTCQLIYRREMLLLDLRDHLLLAGGLPDDALTAKLADFFAFSHEAIQHVTAVKTTFPGAAGEGCLLLDYIPKVREDVVEVKRVMPASAAGMGSADQSLEEEEEEEGSGVPRALASDYTQHKVKLAAELVLESVQREAEAYLKILASDSRRVKGRKETARPP